MKKRQAEKIMFRYAITGNQPVIYTEKQIHRAWRLTNPKNHTPMLTVISFDKDGFTYTINTKH